MTIEVNNGTQFIHAAIEGYELQKLRIDAQIADLRQMLKGATVPVTGRKPVSAERGVRSEAVRQRMAAAQKKRWAEIKAKASTQNPAATPASAPTAKTKRVLSAAGRKRISVASKKRWAAARASQA